MHRIAAKIAEEVGVLFEHDHRHALARQQIAQHHARRSAARNAAGGPIGFHSLAPRHRWLDSMEAVRLLGPAPRHYATGRCSERRRFSILESSAGIGWEGGLGPPRNKSLMAGPSLSPENSTTATINSATTTGIESISGRPMSLIETLRVLTSARCRGAPS
jgi:hypothetical protein